MLEDTKISSQRVMQRAHYLFTKCYGWYRTMHQIYTFSDFLRFAWEEEKKKVAATIAIEAECEQMRREIEEVRKRRININN